MTETNTTLPWATNSPAYWDHRFTTDWETRGGPDQTAFFARQALLAMPAFLRQEIQAEALDLFDFGCAQGDALPVLQAQFPASRLAGGDVAAACLTAARARHPGYRFDLLQPDGPLPGAAVYFCSNTLEHFADWPQKLAAMTGAATRHVLFLVPFDEKEPIEEHVVRFRYSSLPTRCGGMALSWFCTFDTSRLADSRWPGRQLLALYSRRCDPPGPGVQRLRQAGDTLAFDARGLDVTSLAEILRCLDQADEALHALLEACFAPVPGAPIVQPGETPSERLGRLRAALAEASTMAGSAAAREAALMQQLAARDAVMAQQREGFAAALSTALETERQGLEARHASALSEQRQSVTASLASSLAEQRVGHEAERAALRAEHNAALSEQRAQDAAAREALRADYASALAAEQAAREALRAEHALALAAEHEAREAALAEQRAQDAAARSAAEADVAASIRRFNISLAGAELALREQAQTSRRMLDEVLSARTWQWLSRALARYQKLRGRPYRAPFMPPLEPITLPRLAWAEAPPRPAPRSVAATPTIVTGAPGDAPVLLTVEQLHRGGVEQVVVDLATGLRELGRSVLVAVAGRGGDCAEVLRQAGIVVREFDHNLAAFERMLEETKPSHALLNHCYFGLPAMAATGVACTEIVHNYYTWLHATRDTYLDTVRPVRRFVAVSTGVAEYHARAFGLPREAIAVQNNPINRAGLLRPEPAILRRIRGSANGFTFVNVAQFWPAKAHALLLFAFAEVHARHPHTRLELLGEAVDTRVAALVRDAVAQYGLEQAVELAGFIDRRALSHRLARAQALVQPSVYEGFSVAMAEAAHFALPIIATAVGGAVDLVRDDDCGILIPPHIPDFLAVDSNTVAEAGLHRAPANRAALVAAMEAMVQDPAGWGERGFIGQTRIDQLTPRMVAQRYLDLMAAG